MLSDNAIFCRLMLKEVMIDVRKHFSKETIKSAWGYKGIDYIEFQIPNCPEFPDGFVWYGQGTMITEAKARGWQAALRAKGVDK